MTGYCIAGPTSGLLKKSTTGANTSVTATIAQSGTVYHEAQGTNCNSGTGVYTTFYGFVDMAGVTHYGSTGWYMTVTFTGPDPNKRYDLVTTANGANTSYTDRTTKFAISGADAYTNASTSGVTIGDGGASTPFCSGYNTVNGYVAHWTDINPGSDGSFVVRVEAGTINQAYGFSAFKLVETTPVAPPCRVRACHPRSSS